MLSAGTRLGVYEVVAAIGAGGMGEVYKATDTRLGRTVAVKVITDHVASDPDLKQRFEREAKALAALSHPHICPVFDVGSQNGIDFLVMEYLEGETLEQRLKKGALPLDQALQLAIQIADALTAAHRFGIIHRDLKPGNIMLTKSGAKLLDFGLAKTTAPAIAGNLSMLPTTPPNVTAQGTILGTFQYMAPEQLEGQEADARTDIFAFGAALYEALTGKQAFNGNSQVRLIGAILKDTPLPPSTVHASIPDALDRIVNTCLAKDPDDRYQSARDLLRDLKWVASGAASGVKERRVAPSALWTRRVWAVTAAAVIALLVTAILALRPDPTPAPSRVQFTIAPPENVSFGGPQAGGTGAATQVSVSPDGQKIVFVAGMEATYQIWLRPIGSETATPIRGSEGGTFPFWSPDSEFIGFFAGGKLKKVQITGGPAIVLADAPSGRGGSWNGNNVIVFAPSSAAGTNLQRVSAAGGVPTVATTIDPASGESFHRWPHFLPDGRHFLYTASTGTCCPAVKPSTIRVGSLDSAETPIALFQAESSASYASGLLLFARDDTLMAQPFDPDARQLTGDPFPLAEHVSVEGSRYLGASVSQNGTLVYGHGASLLAAGQLTWFDRSGRMSATVGEPSQYLSVALSPDERRIAVTSGPPNPAERNRDIWILDAARGVRSRQTFDPGIDEGPVWSPDGARIAFGSERSGKFSLRQKVVDGTAADETLIENAGSGQGAFLTPNDWSADGRFIAYTVTSAFPRASDVWVLPLFGDRKPFPVAQTAFFENSGAFSSDGRWIAYTSNEAGQPNVYVQPFPAGNAKYQVSRDGGSDPRWRKDGRELFYIGGDGTIMAVSIDASSQFRAGEPEALFSSGALSNSFFQWAVARDGKRFLLNGRPQQSSSMPLSVVMNWTAPLQK